MARNFYGSSPHPSAKSNSVLSTLIGKSFYPKLEMIQLYHQNRFAGLGRRAENGLHHSPPRSSWVLYDGGIMPTEKNTESWRWQLIRYGNGMFNWQRFAADKSEDEIERMLKCADTVEALRWIDQMEVAGTYEVEKNKLQVIFNELDYESRRHWAGCCHFVHPLTIQDLLVTPEALAGWLNLVDGTVSSDPNERKAYRATQQALERQFKTSMTPEVAPILSLIRMPKKDAGRKKMLSPTEADKILLAKMRLHIFRDGLSVSGAAKKLSIVSNGQSSTAIQKRLERWWRWKIGLREYPLEYKSGPDSSSM